MYRDATVLNDDDDDEDDEDLMVSLTKDRRSGLDRRAQDPDSAHQFRQDIEREYRAEIHDLREAVHQKDMKISDLYLEITKLHDWQTSHEEMLKSAHRIMNIIMGFRDLLAGVITLTAAIGGIALIREAIKSWFSK